MSTKDIRDIHKEIYKVLDSSTPHDPSAELAAKHAMNIGGELAKSTLLRDKPREMGKLWASDLGTPCPRKLWYQFHYPEKKEKLQGHTKFKFLYGHLIESSILYLAEEAGYQVENQQTEVEAKINRDWVIRGRTDATINGHVVDVKSTSTFGYNKYKKEGYLFDQDNFGYGKQLAFYHWYMVRWSTSAAKAYLLTVDKQNGHILPVEVDMSQPELDHAEIERSANTLTSHIEHVLVDTSVPVGAQCSPVPDGVSGNLKLSTVCSYCDFKRFCWRASNKGRGLRTFAYSTGPKFFTDIVKEPRVPEIHKPMEDG